MKLLELLVQELPKRGGWPDGATCVAQDPDKLVMFADCDIEKVKRRPDNSGWFMNAQRLNSNGDKGYKLAHDHSTAIVTRKQYEAALAAAQQSVWNGEGLPPVGCECEYNAYDTEWKKGIVLYMSDYTILLRTERAGDPEEAFTHEDIKFRPIRSEANKKRDEVIEALAYYVSEKDAPDLYAAIAACKIEGVKLDV